MKSQDIPEESALSIEAFWDTLQQTRKKNNSIENIIDNVIIGLNSDQVARLLEAPAIIDNNGVKITRLGICAIVENNDAPTMQAWAQTVLEARRNNYLTSQQLSKMWSGQGQSNNGELVLDVALKDGGDKDGVIAVWAANINEAHKNQLLTGQEVVDILLSKASNGAPLLSIWLHARNQQAIEGYNQLLQRLQLNPEMCRALHDSLESIVNSQGWIWNSPTTEYKEISQSQPDLKESFEAVLNTLK